MGQFARDRARLDELEAEAKRLRTDLDALTRAVADLSAPEPPAAQAGAAPVKRSGPRN